MARPSLLGVGLLAAGAAVGALVERRLVRRPLESAGAGALAYGSLHGPPLVVTADDGVELYVEVDEARAGAVHADLTVVLTHGYALNLDCWHHQRLALSGAARCVYWDQRGHGRSGRGDADHATIDQLADDLHAVVTATAPSGPVVLVGHSMGGMSVLALAERHPELFGDRVVGVALLATSAGEMAEVSLGLPAGAARAVRRMLPRAAATLAARPGLVDVARRTGSDLEFLVARRFSFASPVPAATVDFVVQMVAATPVDVIADFYPALNAHERRAAMATLRGVPTLVMVGEGDLLTPVAHSREIARLLPEAELVVLPDCGHLLLLEHPQQVNARLRDLLDRAAG